jgi:hypothetical protein
MRPTKGTPASVVVTNPTPPVNGVPPTTTAAIENNSHPTPSAGWPAPNCAARIPPARLANTACLPFA